MTFIITLSLKITSGHDGDENDRPSVAYTTLEYVSPESREGVYFPSYHHHLEESLTKRQCLSLLKGNTDRIEKRRKQLLQAHTEIQKIKRSLKENDGYWERVDVVVLVQSQYEWRLA